MSLSLRHQPADAPDITDRAGTDLLGQPGAIVGFGIVLAFLLALPGATATNKYLNDLFVFLDGAYRLLQGHVPNIDFHSSLGPLTYVIPAFGYVVGGSWGAAMPVGMALVVLFLSLIAAHVVSTRMRPIVGLPAAAFLLLVAAAPVNSGEAFGELSFAMFYNRLGWCALGLLLIMYLEPSSPRPAQTALDAVCCALLVLLMVYLKATYSLVMLAFMILMFFDRKQWRWPVLALGIVAAAILIIELLWRGHAGYLADLRSAAAVSGDASNLKSLRSVVLRNLSDIVVFGLFAILLVAIRRNLRDLLFLGFCASTGILIINQNFQINGILSLCAGAAVVAEALARRHEGNVGAARFARGAPLLLAAFLLPAAFNHAGALGLHTALAAGRNGEKVALRGFDGILIAQVWHEGATPRFLAYNRTLADAAAALEKVRPVGSVLVLDFVGPFTAGLGLPASRGTGTWYHWDRTIDDQTHPPAEDLLADVDLILEPKLPVERWTASGMARLYAEQIKASYRLVLETEFWKIYQDAGTADDALPLISE